MNPINTARKPLSFNSRWFRLETDRSTNDGLGIVFARSGESLFEAVLILGPSLLYFGFGPEKQRS